MDNLGLYTDDTGRRRSTRLRKTSPPKIQQVQPVQPVQQVKPKKSPRTNITKTPSVSRTPKTAVTKQAASVSRSQTATTGTTATKQLTMLPIPKRSSPIQQFKRARSFTMNADKPHITDIRRYKSLSPIYKRKPNISLKNNSITKPKDFLKYRLEIYNYLKTAKKDDKYYLNIEKLLANIEPKATGIVCMSNNSEIILDDKPIKTFKFAIKIALNKENDSVKEIFILKKLQEFVQKGYQNFPIIYHSIDIKKKNYILQNMQTPILDDVSNFMNNRNFYNVYINELANSDLRHFLKDYDNNDQNSKYTDELLLNAVAQIFMSIASLHNVGIKHNDTHFGNFLYHEIKPGGYIKYTIKIDSNKTETYYVKNLGFLWVIWDYGISTQLNYLYSDYFYDYEMLSLFLRKDVNRYNMHFKADDKDGKEVRRKHGNLNFVHKQIPSAIVKVTDTIYDFSCRRTRTGDIIKPDIPYSEGNQLFTSKDPILKNKLSELSMMNYRLENEKKEYINEGIFLTKYMIEQLSSVFEKDVSVDDNDILFEVKLDLDPIVFKLKADGRTDYEQIIKEYAGKKIILEELKLAKKK